MVVIKTTRHNIVVRDGMIMVNISDYYQQIILGFVLLAAVGFDNKVSGRLKGK